MSVASTAPTAPTAPLAAERSGHGAPLVLLHGVGHFGRAWRPVVALLSREFDVIALDLPGFGASAPLPDGTTPTVPALAEAVTADLRARGIEHAHVAGNSMGGALALELALSGVAASTTAFSPAGFWTDAERRYCQLSLGLLINIPGPARPGVLAAVRTAAGRRVLLAQLSAHPERLPAEEAVATLENAWASPSFAATLAAFSGYELRPDHAPTVPVTVAWGATDRLLIPRQADRARERLPEATHVRIGTGHVPFTDDPEAVAATIWATVARARATSSATAATAVSSRS
ncbi:MAG TPA: alpha/beta fold hydrolase [Solirubrobacteraceae bacterium]|nr:alpha/beta fold hydrolase [Solirubrobacteraceae bacterium]